MFVEVLKSKIHRVKITQAELHYVGSITIDPVLMEAANIIENEKVQIVNINNGERLDTYVIQGKRANYKCCNNNDITWDTYFFRNNTFNRRYNSITTN